MNNLLEWDCRWLALGSKVSLFACPSLLLSRRQFSDGVESPENQDTEPAALMLLRREIGPEEVDASSALHIAPALASRVWNNMDQSVSHTGAQGTGAVI